MRIYTVTSKSFKATLLNIDRVRGKVYGQVMSPEILSSV